MRPAPWHRIWWEPPVKRSIQRDKGYAASLHTDANNEGPSYILRLGEYTGGELLLYDSYGSERILMEKPIRGFPQAKNGTVAAVRQLD